MSERITWTNETRRLSELQPWPRNPRQIKDKQVTRLQESLSEFGQVEPICIGPGNELYNGHQRLKSWDAKFGDIEIDVRVSSRELTEKEREKLTVFLHKGAAGEWDFDTLANEFEVDELVEWGFSEKELTGLDFGDDDPAEDAGAQVDKAEELHQKWGVESGQLWKLGEHRLICGDCTDDGIIKRLLGDDSADVLLNDPPYGMRLDADFSGMVNHLDFAQEKGVKNGNKYANVIGDDVDYDASPVMVMFQDVKEQFWWGADYYSATLGDTMHNGAWLVWDKRLDESADKMYGSCFELLWSKQRHKRDILRHKWAGIFGTEHEPQRGRMHPNQKPVELYEDLLTRYSDKGAVIADCYVGSGTTLIACERLGRKCRAVEISPAYVAVAIQRWVDMTGGIPELIAS